MTNYAQRRNITTQRQRKFPKGQYNSVSTNSHTEQNPHLPRNAYTRNNDQMSSQTVHVSFPPHSRESPGPSGVTQRTGRHRYPTHSTYHSCVLMNPRARGCVAAIDPCLVQLRKRSLERIIRDYLYESREDGVEWE